MTSVVSRWRRLRGVSLLILLFSLTGCAAHQAGKPSIGVTGAPEASEKTSGEVVPFIRNDYQRAINEASSHKLPVFVETWAGW